jgi:hypothetical protein
MPTWQHPDSGYRAYVDARDRSLYLEWNGTAGTGGDWLCHTCGAVITESPAQTFDSRADRHLEGHRA